MNCQSRTVSSFIKEDEEILDIRDSKFSTNATEVSWNVEIQLGDLKMLFKDILLMIPEVHIELNIILKKSINLLDDLLKMYDNNSCISILI
jgi:hypothetical protein